MILSMKNSIILLVNNTCKNCSCCISFHITTVKNIFFKLIFKKIYFVDQDFWFNISWKYNSLISNYLMCFMINKLYIFKKCFLLPENILCKESIVIAKKIGFEIFTYLYVLRSPEFICAIFTVMRMCICVYIYIYV